MDDDRIVSVSPRHAVKLAREYTVLVDRPPQNDYVVRTIARKEANGLPLMSAEIVIAGRETREKYSLAKTYPLHFRKTYTATRLHGDTEREYRCQTLASEVVRLPPAIGFSSDVFRSCLVPGRPYQRISPFGVEPEERNMRIAQDLSLAEAAGLWRLSEDALSVLTRLHEGGLAHGDAELHNFVVCPGPLELVIIDFESAVQKADLDAEQWTARCVADLIPLCREAIFLQCALGRQEGALAEKSFELLPKLFKSPDRFRKAIEEHGDLSE
jgi:hypothetical protein